MLDMKRRVIGFIVLILGLLAIAHGMKAQHIERKGNTFVQVIDSAKKTSFTFEAKDGTKYPIYLSAKGKAFIIRKSKKTGKEYRQYLPEVTKQLNKYKNV